ncbi:hypothetical protein AA313_de0206506 [Arthrobotrys entomopaga]|nr:hypothetical protein AA313_de0206506 [Arthrobotrys entomopaga]
MVCQPPPRQPRRNYYTDLPTNLPSRYVAHRVFVVSYGDLTVFFPQKARTKPAIRLTVPRAPSPDKPVYIRLEIIGWRWAIADTMNPTTDLYMLGLNVPGVPGYDASKDQYGEPVSERKRKRQERVSLRQQQQQQQVVDSGMEETHEKRLVEGLRRVQKTIVKILDKIIITLNNRVERQEGRRMRMREMDAELELEWGDTDTVTVDVNFEKFMRMDQREWS